MTHYELLGVDPSATAAEINAAYQARARRAHPDTGLAGNGDHMAAINAAWHVLGDPARREAYDAALGRRATIGAKGGAQPRSASTSSYDGLGPDVVSNSSLRLLRRLLLTTMVLAVIALAAIVLIGSLAGPVKTALDLFSDI